MADIEGIISNAIADLPGRGDDTGSTDTADIDVDSGDTSTEVADDTGTDTTLTDGEATEASGDDPPPAAVAAPVKKFPKHVPWARFDAQQKAKVAAEERIAAIEAEKAAIAAERDSFDRTLKAFEDETQIDRIAEVLLADPRWSSRLTRAQKQELKEAAAQPAPRSATTVGDLPTVPEADIELADGSRTWSPETFSKYVADVAAHAASAAERKAEERIAAIEGRLKPFEQKVENEQQIEVRAGEFGQELARLSEVYGADLVSENKTAMHSWLKEQWGNPDKFGRPTTPVKNPRATLRDAEYAVLKKAEREKYEKGRSDALSAADKARERVISDQNTRAAAAERPATAAHPPAPASGNLSIEDVIKRSMRKAGIAAA